MAATYSKLHIHLVWHVRRPNRLSPSWRDELFKYMAGIVQQKGLKSIIINGTENHVHLFVGLKPSQRIDDLVRDLKRMSSLYLKSRRLVSVGFSWQEGYAVFSVSGSVVPRLYQYILNQEEHHRKMTFKEEYMAWLKAYGIEYDERFMFDDLDDKDSAVG